MSEIAIVGIGCRLPAQVPDLTQTHAQTHAQADADSDPRALARELPARAGAAGPQPNGAPPPATGTPRSPGRPVLDQPVGPARLEDLPQVRRSLERGAVMARALAADGELLLALTEAAGFDVGPIRYPTLPEGEARIRSFVTSDHTRQQRRHTVDTLAEVAAP